MIKNVAFFGYADAKPESSLYKEAFRVAQILAQNGYTIVNGGGPGVMDASTKGAESVGGETLAVTFSPKDAPGFEGRYLKNVVDQEIKTKNYIERMFKLLEHAQTFVIFRGGTGTISEFGTAWVLARLYYGHHKPFVLFGDFWHEIIAVLTKHMKMRGKETRVFEIVDKPEEVLVAIREFERR
ncbi:MAG: LOG family protein [Candidatus Chisholmbacteria bacterium]|nr:LOG family protein [Candidatus Chisholmbacteria bacterium]